MSDLEKTIKALIAALEVTPNNVPLRVHLAETYREAGRIDEAIAEYQAAAQLDDSNTAAHAALGELFSSARKFDQAYPELRRAVELAPYDARLLMALAEAESALGLLGESLMHIGIARSLNPELAKTTLPPARLSNDDSHPAKQSKNLPGSEVASVERPAISFQQVGGLEEVKEQVRLKIIYPFERPELYKAYGKKAGGGILLFGPPGCGKTLLARATAGEVHAEFIHVSITEVVDMFHGQSEKKLHSVFDLARTKVPAVLFFDEVDAIGGKRLDMRENFQRAEVNQFLAEMDGMEGSNEQLLIVGATNAPWNVDSAFLRPGRFDRVVFVPPPDYEARLAILKIHLEGKPLANVDTARLARDTEGFSGADLMGLVETATDRALQESMRTNQIQPLTTEGLVKAMRETRLSMEDWLNTARDYATYSNTSGFYNDVTAYLKKRPRR